MKAKSLLGFVLLISMIFSVSSCGTSQDVASRKSIQNLTAQVYTVSAITGAYNSTIEKRDGYAYYSDMVLFAASDDPNSQLVHGLYFEQGSTYVKGIVTGTVTPQGDFSGTWHEGSIQGPFNAKFTKNSQEKFKFNGTWKFGSENKTYSWTGLETKNSAEIKESINDYIDAYNEYYQEMQDDDGDVTDTEDEEQSDELELQEGLEIDSDELNEEGDVMLFDLPDLLADKVTVREGKQVYIFLENAGQESVSSADGIKISVELFKADENIEEGTIAINIPYYINASDLENQEFLKAGHREQYYLTDFSDFETNDSLKVCVDTNDVVDEDNEENNCFRATLVEKDSGFTLEIE